MQHLVSFLVLQLCICGRERGGCFTLTECSTSLHRGAVKWSTVIDCGISRSYSITFCVHFMHSEDSDQPGYFDSVKMRLTSDAAKKCSWYLSVYMVSNIYLSV